MKVYMITKFKIKYLYLVIFYLNFFTICKANEVKDSLELLIKKYKFEEVIKLAQQLEKNKVFSPDIYYCEGISYRNLYKIPLAILSFENAYKLDTSNISILNELANCYKICGDYKNEIKYYKKLLDRNPNQINAKYEIASIYFANENYNNAISIYLSLYFKDSSNIYLIKSIAKCYENNNKEDSALYFFNKTIQLDSMDNQAIINLSNYYIKKKKFELALYLTEKYLHSDSTNTKINSINAYLYTLIKDYKSSYIKFLNCFNNKDSSRFILKYLGINAFKIDSFEASKFYLEKAYNIDSSDYQVTYFLGLACSSYIYKQLGIYYLNKTTKLLMPDSVYLASVYFNLGKAYDSYDKSPCENGYNAFIRAHELNPKDTLTLLFIAFKYDNCIRIHDKEMAIKFFKQFIATRPKQKSSDKKNPFVFSYYDSALKRLAELEVK